MCAQDYYRAVAGTMMDAGGGFFPGAGRGAPRPGPGGAYPQAGGYGQGYGGQAGYANGAAAGRGYGYEDQASTVIRLRGLPFSAQKDDIVRWFDDLQIQPISADK
jgi:hypothetical protein